MPDTTDDCPFCDIFYGRAPATILRHWTDALAFTPLEPHVTGHILIIPRKHIERPDDDPSAFGALCEKVALIARGGRYDYNLALNAGPFAGQTVRHVHVHLLPRRPGDGMLMPWDRP